MSWDKINCQAEKPQMRRNTYTFHNLHTSPGRFRVHEMEFSAKWLLSDIP